MAEPIRAYWVDDNFIPLKLPIQDVFEAIKGQPWVKHPKVKQNDPARLGTKDYCSFHDNKVTGPLNTGLFVSTSKLSSSKAVSESTSSPPEPPQRQKDNKRPHLRNDHNT